MLATTTIWIFNIYLWMCPLKPYAIASAVLLVILYWVMVFASVADGYVCVNDAFVADGIAVVIHCYPTSILRHCLVPFAPFDQMICSRISLMTPDPAFRPALWFSTFRLFSKCVAIVLETHSPHHSTWNQPLFSSHYIAHPSI